jgi:polysaccharide pyruvyl transferase CsaB
MIRNPYDGLNVVVGTAGSFGGVNIGDEAILSGLLILLKTLGKVKVTVFSSNVELTQREYNVNAIDYLNVAGVINSLLSADILLCGGGTIIGNEVTDSTFCHYYNDLIANAHKLNKKVVLIGIGANRIQLDESRRVTRNYLAKVDQILTRDDESTGIIRGLVDRKLNLHTTADLAWLIKPASSAKTKKMLAKHGIPNFKRPVVGVSVVNEIWQYERQYKDVLARVCDHMAEQYDARIIFLCNDTREDPYYDRKASEDILGMMKHSATILDNRYYKPEDMAGIYGACQLVIGMRLHALIFAALSGVPFVAISRADKIANFVKICGLRTAGEMPNLDFNKIRDMIDDTWRHRVMIGESLAAVSARMHKKSLANRDLLKQVLDPILESRLSRPKIQSVRQIETALLLLSKKYDQVYNARNALENAVGARDQRLSRLDTELKEVNNNWQTEVSNFHHRFAEQEKDRTLRLVNWQQAEEKLAKAEGIIKGLNEKIQERDIKIVQIDTELRKVNEEFRKWESKLHEEIAEQEEDRAARLVNWQQAEEKLARSEVVIKELNEKIQERDIRIAQIDTELREVNEEFRKRESKLHEEIAKQEKDRTERLAGWQQAEEKLARAEGMINGLNEKIQECDIRIAQIDTELREVNEEFYRRGAEFQQQRAELEGNMTERLSQLQEKAAEVERLEAGLKKLRHPIYYLLSILKSLKMNK